VRRIKQSDFAVIILQAKKWPIQLLQNVPYPAQAQKQIKIDHLSASSILDQLIF
jgi:hypothetical protein